MPSPEITVVIPTIPPREQLLARALRSVDAQTLPAAGVSIAIDNDRLGAGATRSRALAKVETPWVAFLDDDDEFGIRHLEDVWRCAEETDADFVYPWYHVQGGTDPRPWVFGRPFDPEHPVQTTVVTLVRTELAKQVGFPAEPPDQLLAPDRLYAGEDWAFTLGCLRAGAKIVHLGEKTWIWHHDSSNTSGRPIW